MKKIILIIVMVGALFGVTTDKKIEMFVNKLNNRLSINLTETKSYSKFFHKYKEFNDVKTGLYTVFKYSDDKVHITVNVKDVNLNKKIFTIDMDTTPEFIKFVGNSSGVKTKYNTNGNKIYLNTSGTDFTLVTNKELSLIASLDLKIKKIISTRTVGNIKQKFEVKKLVMKVNPNKMSVSAHEITFPVILQKFTLQNLSLVANTDVDYNKIEVKMLSSQIMKYSDANCNSSCKAGINKYLSKTLTKPVNMSANLNVENTIVNGNKLGKAHTKVDVHIKPFNKGQDFMNFVKANANVTLHAVLGKNYKLVLDTYKTTPYFVHKDNSYSLDIAYKNSNFYLNGMNISAMGGNK